MIAYLSSSDPADTIRCGFFHFHSFGDNEAHVAVDNRILGIRALFLRPTTMDTSRNLIANLQRSLELRTEFYDGSSVITAVDHARKGLSNSMFPIGRVLLWRRSWLAVHILQIIIDKNTYLRGVFDLNEYLIDLGLWNRDFGDWEPIGLQVWLSAGYYERDSRWCSHNPFRRLLLANLTDLILGPCPHNLRDLRVRLGMDRHLFAVVWYKKNGSQLLVVKQMK